MHGKKLVRSSENKVIAGVMGGIGEYLEVDPNAIRLIYALITVFTGFFPGIIAYVVAMLILPTRVTVITPSEPVVDDAQPV